MDFKTDRVRQEWADLRGGAVTAPAAPLLVPLALYVDDVSLRLTGKHALVTMIQRDTAEQLDLTDKRNAKLAVEGKPLVAVGTRSVHEFWRGIDFRSWIYDPDEIGAICRDVNAAFRYSDRLVALALHRYGSATHLHGQVPVGRQWKV
jgi:hypothetical protein